MKTLRFLGMALIAILVSVSFSACSSSSDDDDNGGGETPASFVGTWYWQSEKWYTDGTMTTVSSEKTYTAETTRKTWTFTQKGSTIYLFETNKKTNENSNTVELKKTGNNEYSWGDDRIVIKSISANKMVVDYIEDYYEDRQDITPDYGTIVLMK